MIEQQEDIDSKESDVYALGDISSLTLDDSQLVTLKLVNSGYSCVSNQILEHNVMLSLASTFVQASMH